MVGSGEHGDSQRVVTVSNYGLKRQHSWIPFLVDCATSRRTGSQAYLSIFLDGRLLFFVLLVNTSFNHSDCISLSSVRRSRLPGGSADEERNEEREMTTRHRCLLRRSACVVKCI